MPAVTDAARFTDWVATHANFEGAQLGARLSGGNSNVTQRVDTATGPLILRRPPDNAISASATNGVRREYRVLRALQGVAPVPAAIALCEERELLGQPFILTGFVTGTAITTQLPPAYADHPDTLRRIGEALVDGIAAVHCADWAQSGMEASAPADYVPRQIERWLKVRATDRVRDLPDLERVGAWLQQHLPAERAVGIIHGDFHLDNTLFDLQEPRLTAIIDWELSTIGDPLADLALMLACWGPRTIDPPGFAFVQQVTRRPGVVSREQLAQRWAERTGHSIERLDYYLVFALWRLAAIVEGAYVLFHQGKVHDDYSRHLEYDVPALLREAAQRACGD